MVASAGAIELRNLRDVRAALARYDLTQIDLAPELGTTPQILSNVMRFRDDFTFSAEGARRWAEAIERAAGGAK